MKKSHTNCEKVTKVVKKFAGNDIFNITEYHFDPCKDCKFKDCTGQDYLKLEYKKQEMNRQALLKPAEPKA